MWWKVYYSNNKNVDGNIDFVDFFKKSYKINNKEIIEDKYERTLKSKVEFIYKRVFNK